jgi:hypothetical protein
MLIAKNLPHFLWTHAICMGIGRAGGFAGYAVGRTIKTDGLEGGPAIHAILNESLH